MAYCPCKDCEKKGCGPYHDKCEPYQKYVRENQAEKKDRRNRYDADFLGKPRRYW